MFSELREHLFREDWYTAYSRVRGNVASSITASRTLVETTLKTIIKERKGTPDSSGDIGKLIKQAEDSLNFKRPERSEEHQILSGINSVISGIAAISNQSGDRHGMVDGVEITNPLVGHLVLNACGAVALFFIELHLFFGGPIEKAHESA